MKTTLCPPGVFRAVLALVLYVCMSQLPVYAQSDGLPRGANLLPYQRYEAESGARGGGASLQSSPQFIQTDIAAEASDQKYVSLGSNGAYVEWTLSAPAQGFNLRFTMPDNSTGTGTSGTLGLYVNDVKVRDIALSSYWAYQYFPAADPQQTPSGGSTKILMRFDEVHFRLDAAIQAGDKVTIKKDNNDGITYGVDFVELEAVPTALTLPANYLSVTDYGANGTDNADDFAAFTQCIAAASSQGKNVYIPAGRFILSNKLLLNVSNIKIQGAGIWHTYVYFSTNVQFSGGILARASHVEISNFSMNTANNARLVYGGEPNPLGQMYKVYKGFMGTYGAGSYVHDIWVEHFECGFWIGGYDPPYPIDVTTNMMISKCRIRNNYADGVNFSQGTSNSTVEQSSVRNNGDDGLAVWPSTDASNNVMGVNNTFRNNTIENNWRAGSIAIFGGTGHDINHNLIKDGVGGSGIRFTNDFAGFTFKYPGDVIKVAENTIIGCGTSNDLWNQKRGAIELYAQTGVFNIQFDNTNILNSQRDAVQLYGNNYHHLIFNNTLIDGTGLDPVVRDVPSDVYGGFGIYAQANSDSAVFNNLTVRNAESGTSLNRNTNFKLIIRDVNIPVTGVVLVTATDTTIATGSSFQLKANIIPVDATNKNLSWTSSNTAAVTVDANGKVTAVGLGAATITVTTQSGNFTATRKVTVTPAVNITATDVDAGEGNNTGTFRISASAITQTVTVNYIISGTAAAADYTTSPALTGSVTLSPTTLAQTITITPVDDNSFEGPETLRLTLKTGTGYQLGNDTTALITITDNDLPPCTAPTVARVTGTAPVIDQTIDGAWSAAPVKSIGNVVLGGVPAGYGGQWRAMYDNTNLYILVQVNDAAKINDSGGSWWEDDVVEIFIDGDNSKTATYDGANDFQLGFRYNDNTLHVGGNSVTRTMGITFSQYATATGYNVEAAIPWNTIGTTAALGKPIGLDVQLDNDDNGGTRDAQLATFATTTTAFQDPRVFGTVYLTNCNATNVPVTGVSVSPATASISTGATQQLVASVLPANASNTNVSWSSGNTSIATVNAAGLVTAVAVGSTVITVTTADQGKTATCAVTVTQGSTIYYRIKNRWQNTYLNDGGAQANYAASPAATDNSYQWSLENVSGGYVEIKNRATGEYINIEHALDYVEVSTRSAGTLSSRWAMENTGDGYVRIRNAGPSNDYIHIENLKGYAQHGMMYPVWQSAQWQLEQVPANALARSGSTPALSISNPNNGQKLLPATEAITLEVYPNPAVSELKLQSKYDLSGGIIYILNSSGNIVMRTNAAARTVNIAALPPGVYTLLFTQKTQKIAKRFVKIP